MKYALLSSDGQLAAHAAGRLILARFLAILLCAAVLLARLPVQSLAGWYGLGGVLGLLSSLGLLNLVYLGLLSRVRGRMTLFVAGQFLIDLAVVTGLCFLTGGVESNFVSFYFAVIMAASFLLSRRNCALFASLATVGLALVTGLYLLRSGLPLVDPIYWPDFEQPPGLPVARMLNLSIAFFVVAYLSGLLSERLALARSLNEEILQNMAEGVAVFDPEGRLAFFNAEFERLFSSDRPLQLGARPEAVFRRPDETALRELVGTRTNTRLELDAEKLEAVEARPLLEIRTSSLLGRGAAGGLVMLAVDLSLRQRVEQAELRAERFAAVSALSASLAHEIRNPLASVRGSIQEISREFETGTPNWRLAQIVLRESDRLDSIITSFLQFARQRPLHPVACNLGEVLRETVDLLRRRPDAAGVEIKLELAAAPTVRCDPGQLREVFMNLGINALAALEGRGDLALIYPHAGVRPRDSALLRLGDEGGVAVTFRDTGRGLPPGAEERIFEPFYTTREGGTGLGLAVVRRVVEAHEGRVWVTSQAGQGAAFHVWLPVSGPFLRRRTEKPEGSPNGG